MLTLCTAVTATVFLHTFIVGATHASRYFILTFPAFYVTGIVGLQTLAGMLAQRWDRTGQGIRMGTRMGTRMVVQGCTVLVGLWFLGVYSADLYFRARVTGLGGVMQDHLALSRFRRESTTGLLVKLGWTGHLPVRLALTEVQLRQYLDNRFWLQSLDGRVDQELIDVTPPSTGCPDYAAYLRRVQSDMVMADQACDCPTSLLCALQREPTKGPLRTVTLDGLRFTQTGFWSIWRIAPIHP